MGEVGACGEVSDGVAGRKCKILGGREGWILGGEMGGLWGGGGDGRIESLLSSQFSQLHPWAA